MVCIPSQIYSNAVALKKALKEKMQESEKGHIIENSGVKTSARLKLVVVAGCCVITMNNNEQQILKSII